MDPDKVLSSSDDTHTRDSQTRDLSAAEMASKRKVYVVGVGMTKVRCCTSDSYSSGE